jgi:hypothetical protein
MLSEAKQSKGGREALRRRWRHLRGLADEVLPQIPDAEVKALLGKPRTELDPEANDLKAVVAYAAGRGLLKSPERLTQALAADETADPLAFLATLSGKSFGETWAPEIARYWLCEDDDRWEKKKSSEFYDAAWFPSELSGREIRIELKASSEHPAHRFQQIRHRRLSGGKKDYDILLCLGVTAGSLEWWAIPTERLDDFADNGATEAGSVLISRHHGKRRPIWNASAGYKDEGWFVADDRARRLFVDYISPSEVLREKILTLVK